MRYTIREVGPSLTGVGQYNNTQTSVFLNEIPDEVYMLHQPQNAPKPGQVIEGSIAPDQQGRLKLTRDRSNFNNNAPRQQFSNNNGFQQQQPRSQYRSQPQERQVKADPAKSDSIENQSYYKQAVDLLKIHAEINPQAYDGKDLRELNEMVIAEAKHAKQGMRNNTTFAERTFNATAQPVSTPASDLVPLEAYNEDEMMADQRQKEEEGLY